MQRDQTLLQRHRPREIQEESLSRAVLADDEAAARSALGDPRDVGHHGLHLGDPADPNTGVGPMVSQRQHERVQAFVEPRAILES